MKSLQLVLLTLCCFCFTFIGVEAANKLPKFKEAFYEPLSDSVVIVNGNLVTLRNNPDEFGSEVVAYSRSESGEFVETASKSFFGGAEDPAIPINSLKVFSFNGVDELAILYRDFIAFTSTDVVLLFLDLTFDANGNISSIDVSSDPSRRISLGRQTTNPTIIKFKKNEVVQP